MDGALSDSDTESEAEVNEVNARWARLMLELDTLKIAAGIGRAKGKKAKSPQVVLDTPDIVKIKSRIRKVEKDYLFNRKEGGETPCDHADP